MGSERNDRKKSVLKAVAALITWSLGFMDRKRSGLILIVLSALLLLVGGGIAPPTIGILAGVAGLAIPSEHRWWRERVSPRILRALLLFVGSMVLVCLFDFNMPDLFVCSFLLAVVLLVLDTVTGTARDLRQSS